MLRHARDADAVVADGADDAGDVGAVAVLVVGVAVLVARVVAVDVVDEAVLVVVEAVAGDLAPVHPQVRLEVEVVEIDAGVEDDDGDGVAPGRDGVRRGGRPRLEGVDVGVGHGGRAVDEVAKGAVVMERPLEGEEGVVRGQHGRVRRSRLDVRRVEAAPLHLGQADDEVGDGAHAVEPVHLRQHPFEVAPHRPRLGPPPPREGPDVLHRERRADAGNLVG